MKCIRCGEALGLSKCSKCGFQHDNKTMMFMWEINSEYLKKFNYIICDGKSKHHLKSDNTIIQVKDNITDKTNFEQTEGEVVIQKKTKLQNKEDLIKSSDENEKEKNKKSVDMRFFICVLATSVFIGVLFFSFNLNRSRKDWSEWTYDLPSYVTKEKYDIKERLLYSNRIKEVITSESKDEKDGWELFDEVNTGVEYGEWSEWSTESENPSGTKEVESEIRYRYREKELTTSENSTKDGWNLDEVTYMSKDYGTWSEWSLLEPDIDNNIEVQQKTQYSFRKKNFTSSNNKIMKGWVCYDTKNTYGEWSEWSNTPVEISSSIDVTTRQVKTGTQYHIAHYCTGNVSGAQYLTAKRNKTTNDVFNGNCTFHSLGWFSSMDQFYEVDDGEYLYKGSTTNNCYRCVNTCYRWYIVEQKDVHTTQYSYREVSPVYYFYQWSSWSDYSDNEVVEENSETRTQILYRYRNKITTPVYNFWRWGEWSNWSTKETIESEKCQVEKQEYYRARDIINKTVYYFRRYTDWSEYSEEIIGESDRIEVKTKTQYSFKKK